MGFLTKYRVIQRAAVVVWLSLLVATMVWFFKQDDVSGDQVAVILGFFGLSGAGVLKMYLANPRQGGGK